MDGHRLGDVNLSSSTITGRGCLWHQHREISCGMPLAPYHRGVPVTPLQGLTQGPKRPNSSILLFVSLIPYHNPPPWGDIIMGRWHYGPGLPQDYGGYCWHQHGETADNSMGDPPKDYGGCSRPPSSGLWREILAPPFHSPHFPNTIFTQETPIDGPNELWIYHWHHHFPPKMGFLDCLSTMGYMVKWFTSQPFMLALSLFVFFPVLFRVQYRHLVVLVFLLVQL